MATMGDINFKKDIGGSPRPSEDCRRADKSACFLLITETLNSGTERLCASRGIRLQEAEAQAVRLRSSLEDGRRVDPPVVPSR